MQTKSKSLTYAKETAMNNPFCHKQGCHSTGRIFIVLLASVVGLLIVAGTLAIVFTPTLSSKAMAAVTDTAPSSAYGVSSSMTPLP